MVTKQIFWSLDFDVRDEQFYGAINANVRI
jgi:hypothetical protein